MWWKYLKEVKHFSESKMQPKSSHFRPSCRVRRLWFESWDLSDWHLSLAERGEVITNTDSPKLLARHLLLCYTNYAQNYHRQTNIVWRSVVVAMSHKLYTKTEMGSWAQWCFVLAFKMSTGLSLNFALTQLKQYCHHFEHKHLSIFFPFSKVTTNGLPAIHLSFA